MTLLSCPNRVHLLVQVRKPNQTISLRTGVRFGIKTGGNRGRVVCKSRFVQVSDTGGRFLGI